MEIETLHHVSLAVSNIARAREFYTGVLGLREDPSRPKFPFDGAWYHVGDRSLHLIVPAEDDDATFRGEKGADSHDGHFAIRVRSYQGAVRLLESKGYRASTDKVPRPTAANPLPMRLSPSGAAGFPQIYIVDPDRNVIEINAATAD